MKFGIAMRLDGGAEFTFISLGMHYHSKNKDDLCDLRNGITFGLLGIHLFIGLVKS